MKLNRLGVKTLIFKILNKFPAQTGFRVYHLIQRYLVVTSLKYKIKSTEDSYRNIERIASKLNLSLKDKKIMEVGSGWVPILPYFFKFFGGVDLVYTYDLNHHYSIKEIKKLNNYFQELYGVQVNKLGTRNELSDKIKYFPNTNVIDAELPQVDIIFSRFVLEHISPEDLMHMHMKFKDEIPDAYIIHFISPSDHRAYEDASLSLQDFLRFSAKEWEEIQTKFDFHNRWRLPHYLQLFDHLGFQVVHLEYDCPPIDSEAYKKFKNLDVHDDFNGLTDDELTAGAIKIVLKV
ncbi:hypothetical protein [Salinimicrobium sp. TH3]|uniref:hypothetical protein n=1 Tax=Salinimicrobium sp. TH3 TaxID=2997342 RepID=UPI002276C411|nr:hypothetical protein [Salinimicrobium sp. TH3]MCY2687862.1 hypothetical protein [Salinimicrobium sp. TH3]